MPKPAPLEERLRNCFTLHPDWSDNRVARAIRGARLQDAITMRSAMAEGKPWVQPGRTTPSTLVKVEPAHAGAGVVTLDQVRKRYDISSAIRDVIATIPPGSLMLEREMCAQAAGKDNNRFRRAVENTPEFKAFRAKLKLDPESGEGFWYWGSAVDIAEAVRLRDE